jgi:tetratricopeptide (TPR) repeat protein
LEATPSFADKPSTAPAAAAASSGDSSTSQNMAPKLELDGPEAEAKDRARTLFIQGVAQYRAGKFYEAVEIFLETQRIYPDAQLCFNVARAYENLGNVAAALRYYRDYLRQADRPSDGDEVKERVRKLSQQLSLRGVQQLSVLSSPEAATVLLDGHPVGITPWTGETYPGKHRLQLVLDGYAGQEQIVELDAYAPRDVTVGLLPAPKPTPYRAAPALLPKPKASASVGSLLTLGTGLVLLGSAIAAQAVSSERGMSRPTAFLAGSGLGVASVGGVLLYFDFSPRSGISAPPHAKDSATLLP